MIYHYVIIIVIYLVIYLVVQLLLFIRIHIGSSYESDFISQNY